MAQRLFKERSGGRGAESVFGGTGLSDDEDDDEDANKLITVKGPLELLRHPQVHHVSVCLMFGLSHNSLSASLDIHRPRSHIALTLHE